MKKKHDEELKKKMFPEADDDSFCQEVKKQDIIQDPFTDEECDWMKEKERAMMDPISEKFMARAKVCAIYIRSADTTDGKFANGQFVMGGVPFLINTVVRIMKSNSALATIFVNAVNIFMAGQKKKQEGTCTSFPLGKGGDA